MAAALRFELPAALSATAPPEARGVARDAVRMLVATPGGFVHGRFSDLPRVLTPADTLVVNTSPTMPAAVDAAMRGRSIALHFSTWHDDGTWTIELRHTDNSGPVLDGVPNEIVRLGDGTVRLVRAADGRPAGSVRLWIAEVEVAGGMRRFLGKHGRPIRYEYVAEEWPLHFYQTVFADLARWPGSAEMASAARPFTARLVADLRAAGVGIWPIELHTGVSSLESHEPPQAERYAVPPATAGRINATRVRSGRVIAVGTTVTRALETVADDRGYVASGRGWTDLVLSPERPAQVVDGLITGWHAPEASHLDLLRAVAGTSLVAGAYQTALENGYLWHEFGDSALFLPGPG